MSYYSLLGLLLATPIALHAQAPTPLNWWADDSARVAFHAAHGKVYSTRHAIVSVPADSLDQAWVARFVDSLDTGVAALKELIGGPHSWQRISRRPVRFYLGPDRFVSHASGKDVVFISLIAVRRGYAPFLHEAAHELLAPPAPFLPFEYPDSVIEERVAAQFPIWLSEGFPDYLAQKAAAASGFREGDVFQVGGLAKVDSACAARLSQSPRKAEILDRVGTSGRLEALFTTERAQVAPVFYACSQSFTRHLVERIGVPGVVALFPSIKAGTWRVDIEKAAGVRLEAIRRDWLIALRLEATSQGASCPPALLGTWEYRQAAGDGYDSEGERIVLTCADGAMRGIYFGLEREGEHGLFYTAVEMTDLKVDSDAQLSFTVGERELFSERPRSLEEVKQKKLSSAGLTRDPLHLRGRIEKGVLYLTCTSAAAACPDKVMAFHNGK